MNLRLLSHLGLALLFTLSSLFAQAQDILTNKDLLQMAELGMGDAIIISRIENANNDFDVTTPALLVLKKAGLNDAVLAKVIEAGNNAARKVVDPNDPLAPHRPGIYYFDEAGTLVELLPTVTSETKDKGQLATRFSYGIAKTKIVSKVTGASARTQLPTSRVFYFYFNQQSTSFDQNTIAFYGFQQATSPNEFTLAQLNEKDEHRELQTGARNYYTSEIGIDEKHGRSFEIEQIASGVFKVTPIELLPGEYCFVYAGAAPYERAQQKVYDFGVGHVSASGVISKQ